MTMGNSGLKGLKKMHFHFILICPLFNELRDNYLKNLITDCTFNNFLELMCFNAISVLLRQDTDQADEQYCTYCGLSYRLSTADQVNTSD